MEFESLIRWPSCSKEGEEGKGKEGEGGKGKREEGEERGRRRRRSRPLKAMSRWERGAGGGGAGAGGEQGSSCFTLARGETISFLTPCLSCLPSSSSLLPSSPHGRKILPISLPCLFGDMARRLFHKIWFLLTNKSNFHICRNTLRAAVQCKGHCMTAPRALLPPLLAPPSLHWAKGAPGPANHRPPSAPCLAPCTAPQPLHAL